MIKRTMVILPGILFLMSGAAIADVVVVSADQPSWTDTGVNVGTDQGVIIQANGLARYDTADDCQNGEAWTGPEGIEEVADETFVVPGLNKYSLIGKIGDGDPFLVGSLFNLSCGQEAGRLFLIHNDYDFSNNSCSHEASVELFFCHACSGSAAASTEPYTSHQEFCM